LRENFAPLRETERKQNMNKSDILEIVQKKLSEKIETLERLISETRASNNETKSSMGDKYETSREMVQQQINTLQLQLNENRRAHTFLITLNVNPHQIIGVGSLVETDKGLFYIAVSCGEIIYEGKKIFVISPESPLGASLLGKKKNDQITLNNSAQNIVNFW